MQIHGLSTFEDFSGGLNTARHKYHLPRDQFRYGNNIEGDVYGAAIKRKGRTIHNVTALGAAVHSLHRLYIGSNRGFLAGSSTVLYRDNSLSGTFTSLATGLSGSVIRGFVMGNWFFFCDGTNMKKYDLTNVRAWSIAKPTTAITGTPTGAGTFSATTGYMYGYTYTRSTDAETEALKTTASTGAFTNKQYVGVLVTASADAQVTNIKLYRTLDGGTVYHYHSTVANTTATVQDSTSDSSLSRTLYDADGHLPPTAGFDCCVFNRRVFVASAGRVLQYSEIGYPEYFPGTANGYTYTLDEGLGTSILRVMPMGTAVIALKNNSLVAIYGTDDPSPAKFEYRVIEGSEGIWAAASLAYGLSRMFWLGSDLKVWTFSPDGLYTISIDIEPIFREATAALMANAVGWFYKNKYFLSFPQSASSTANDCIFYYDVRTEGWWPYTLDFGVNSAAFFNGPSDSNQLYAGDTSAGYVDRLDVPDAFTDRGNSYSPVLKTRFDNAGNLLNKKKYWLVSAEVLGDADITLITDSGFTSPHTITNNTETWVGGWIGGWTSNNTDILDNDVVQGLKGRYVSVEYTGASDSSDKQFICAAVGYEVEAKT